MAQVTMDSKEYIELLDKARAWDKLHTRIVENTEVDINEEHYRGYRIAIGFALSDKAINEVAHKVAKTLAESDTIMKALVEDNLTMLNLKEGYMSHDWGKHAPEEVDLMKFPEFKTKYMVTASELGEEEE